MNHFAVGLISLGCALLLTVACYLGYLVRCAGSWLMGKPQPTDRIFAIMAIFAVIGFLAGSFIQPQWDKGAECRLSGQSLVHCFFVR